MDASDRTQRRKAITSFVDQGRTFSQNNPGGGCNALVGNAAPSLSNVCNRSYASYEQRLLFSKGRKVCVGCATS
jgi:hypothetical protein